MHIDIIVLYSKNLTSHTACQSMSADILCLKQVNSHDLPQGSLRILQRRLPDILRLPARSPAALPADRLLCLDPEHSSSAKYQLTVKLIWLPYAVPDLVEANAFI